MLNIWNFEFLTSRSQYVQMNNTISNTIITNTGAPQGCVMSPVLYTLYTNDFTVTHNNTHLLKFADDSAIIGLFTSKETSDYPDIVESFYQWCKTNYLLLNVKKTKELIIDFRRNNTQPVCPILINNKKVDIVNEAKYLGITIDSQLNWHSHVTNIFKKANQRMYFLRKLRFLNVSKSILRVFYTMTIQSVIMYGITCWGGNVLQKDKNKVNTLVKKASKLCDHDLPRFDEL